MDRDPDKALAALEGAMDKYVKNQGRNTVLLNAARDEARVGYARVAGPGACEFCQMLSSRGFQYASASSAGIDARFHPHCSCGIAVAFKDSKGRIRAEGVDGEVPEDWDPWELYEQWAESGRKFKHNRERENAMRRARRHRKEPAAKPQNHALGEKAVFHTSEMDPVGHVLGPAKISHPERVAEIEREAARRKVRVRFDSDGTIAYSPLSPEFNDGFRGEIVATPETSIAALEHEWQHVLSDEASGWAGYGNMASYETEWAFEREGYRAEIETARKLGLTGEESEIRAIMEQARREIWMKHNNADYWSRNKKPN